MAKGGYWHRITDETMRDKRGHLLPESERVICYTRGKDTLDAEMKAGRDLGRDWKDLCASRACFMRRARGQFVR